MKWEYYISQYVDRHCSARGLQISTLIAYRMTLEKFSEYIIKEKGNVDPESLSTGDVLDYIGYLRGEKNNKASAVNRSVVVISNFYKALVSLNCIEPKQNPMVDFPKMKAPMVKFRDTLDRGEIKKLIDMPRKDTVLGIRDRAILTVLYGTGIRASECANLKEKDVKIAELTITVIGKGGNQRTVPLNKEVAKALEQYTIVRGCVKNTSFFFKSRKSNGISRGAIYERVRNYAKKARLGKKVTPHSLRHTFATHLVRMGENLVVIRDLLGHCQLSSTQIYLNMTGEDMRKAIDKHPVEKLISTIKDMLPGVKLPFQYPPGERFAFIRI